MTDRGELLVAGRVVADAGAAGCVWIRDGAVAAVGQLDELRARAAPGTRVLEGGAVSAGFHDAHVHLWKVGQLRVAIADLRGATDLERALRESRAGAGLWVLGRGLDEALLAGGALPDRRGLDRIVDGRPAWLIRRCGHVGVASSKALELAGVGAGTPDPPGGRIVRDAQGVPTGVLEETAMKLVAAAVPEPSGAEIDAMLRAGAEALVEVGVTSATDPGVGPALLDGYRRLDAAGRLPLRAQVMALGADAPGELVPLPARTERPRLRVDTVKFFLDGGLSGRTAALGSGYRDSDDRGCLRLDRDAFRELARPAHDAGLRVAAHAIGDAAIEVALDVFEELGRGAGHRIEHLGLPSAEQLARVARLGLGVATQAIFLDELGVHFRRALPDDFPITPYPFRAMLDAGIDLALSSDGPVVAELSPLAGIASAARRRDAEGHVHDEREGLEVRESLHAYTVAGAALAGGPARGRLAPGLAGDCVVLSRDPLDTPVEELAEIEVRATVVGGDVVWEAGA